MSEQDLAALGAADEVVTPAPEAAEITDGQDQTPPAPEETEAEKTETQKRRERRVAHEQRLKDQAADAERRAAEAETRLNRIKASATGAEPKEADFADFTEYMAAKAAFAATKAITGFQAAEIEAEAGQAKQDLQQIEAARFQARQEELAQSLPEARAVYADFDAAIAVAKRADIVSPELSMMILASDQPADLAYHLGKNPDLARTLSHMPPIEAAMQLGRISAGLQRPQPKTVSTAPAPINPVKPGGTAAKDPSKMSFKEFKAWREAGGKP